MLKQNLLSKFVLLCAVLLAGATSYAQEVTWVKTAITALSTNDVIVIVDQTSSKALSNNNGTSSAPAATSVTLSDDKSQITSDVAATIQWVITVDGSSYKFGVSDTENYLYCTNTNNGVRVGTNDNNVFTLDGNWLKNTGQSRWVGVYSDQDWRCYTNTTGNIKGTVTAFYKKTVSGGGDTPEPGTVAAPTFSPAAGAVAYGTTVTLTQEDAAIIMYTTDGTDPSYENLVGEEYTSPIAITVATTIKAIAVDDKGNESSVATAAYTIAAPAAPVISPAGGKVVAGSKVTLAADVDMILYTTDGTTPSYENNVGEIYTEAITITEACTLKAIAVDDGGNESEVAEATFAIKVAGELGIDFEDDLATYETDWEFTNINVNNSAITAHGGSKYGTNTNSSGNAVTAATILTKSPIANPGTLTFYVSKTSNNSTSSTWYVQVSSDGNNFEDVSSHSAADMTKGTWEEISVDLASYNNVYVRIQYAGSNAIRAIDDITLTVATPKNVATPTFNVESGDFFGTQNVTIACATDGAEIYYTLDGTTPTKSSTKYTGAIAVSTTTTINAIAYNGEDDSNVATVTLTFPTVYANIAAFKTANTTGYLNVKGAQVVYIDQEKKNIYVRDASGAIDVFNSTGFTTDLKTGDLLDGVLYGKYSPYQNLPEIGNADLSRVTVTGNETVVAKTISGTTEAMAANLCDLVKIENAEIVLTSSKYYVGDNSDIQLYDGLHIGISFDEGNADVQGIATVYNTTYELFPRYESDIVYLDNAVAVEIGAAGMATFSCDKALDFTGVDAIAAYTATVTTEGKITFTRIYEVPANTGLLLRNAQGEDKGAVAAVNVPVIASAAAVAENALVAVDTEIAQLATETTGYVNYILNKVNGNLGFYKANNQKVAAGKAYLQVSATTARASFAISFDDETTGIATVENASVLNENYYNLNGQRIVAPQKGLYIVNGKKVVLK